MMPAALADDARDGLDVDALRLDGVARGADGGGAGAGHLGGGFGDDGSGGAAGVVGAGLDDGGGGLDGALGDGLDDGGHLLDNLATFSTPCATTPKASSTLSAALSMLSKMANRS